MKHLAFIPDGCRRWAKSNGWIPSYGHKVTFEKIPRLAEHVFLKKDINTFTCHMFSSENWGRSKEETDFLMYTSAEMLSRFYFDVADGYNVKMNHIGRTDRLPSELLTVIESIERLTRDNKSFVFNYCIDYSGQDEIKRAHELAKENNGKIENYLYTSKQAYPFPDLIIRAGNETRLSGFMLYQSAYSELIFSNKLGPEFDENSIDSCIEEYNKRKRRFGK